MRRAVAAAAVALLALVGCSSSDASDGAASGGAEAPFELEAEPVTTNEVGAVKSYRFDPQVVEVSAGEEVTWTNDDDFPHNVHFLTGDDATYDLPIGDSVAVTFDEPGDYYYECSIHPQQMRGQVIVTQ